MPGSVSSAADPEPGGVQTGPSSENVGMKSPRSMTVCYASRINGSDFPTSVRRFSRLVGDARARVTSTNNLPPASAMRRGGVNCQKESPSGVSGSVIIC